MCNISLQDHLAFGKKKIKRWLFGVHRVYEFLIVPFGGQAWDTLSPTQIQDRGHGRALVSASHPCSKEES